MPEDYNGQSVRMMVTQVFESDETARVIFEEIADAIPGTEFIDRGIKIYDRLDFEKLEHVN